MEWIGLGRPHVSAAAMDLACPDFGPEGQVWPCQRAPESPSQQPWQRDFKAAVGKFMFTLKCHKRQYRHSVLVSWTVTLGDLHSLPSTYAPLIIALTQCGPGEDVRRNQSIGNVRSEQRQSSCHVMCYYCERWRGNVLGAVRREINTRVLVLLPGRLGLSWNSLFAVSLKLRKPLWMSCIR